MFAKTSTFRFFSQHAKLRYVSRGPDCQQNHAQNPTATTVKNLLHPFMQVLHWSQQGQTSGLDPLQICA